MLINVAMTVDGKIDTVERRGAPVSSEADRDRVQRLRADADAVMVGRRTLLQEDPRLTVRAPELIAERVARGAPPQPAKVSIVHDVGELRAESRFVHDGPARVILFSGARIVAGALASARELGVELHVCPAAGPVDPSDAVDTADANDTADAVATAGAECSADVLHAARSASKRVDLVAALERLGALGIEQLLVEGGGSLNFELLRLGLVDELQVYLAPLVFGGASAPTLADGAGLSRPMAIRLVRTDLSPYPDGGMLLRYKVEQS